jgi:ferredoxin
LAGRIILDKVTIYYFTGTGNSLVVARDIAGKTNAKLISIPTVMDKESITTEADVIGIVFPVYHAVFDGLPLIIEKFAEKMKKLDTKYIFAVCTCRGWSRVALSKLDEIIQSRGGKIAAGFTAPMPDNTVPSTKEQQQKFFINWKKKLETISKYVNDRKKGSSGNTVLFNVIMAPFTSPLQKTTIKLLNKLANTTDLPLKKALPLTDKSLMVDEKCNGCGICAKVCPVDNIKIVSKKPVWQNRCESCLACVNWCPQEAIQGGISFENNVTIRYHHPDVKIKDMLKQS